MADELISSLKDIRKEIDERIKWHESEVIKLTRLREACLATMNGDSPKAPVVKQFGLESAIVDIIAAKDSQEPGFTFHWIMLDEWLEHKWSGSSISGALTNLVAKGIIEQVGLTTPIKPHGGKIKKQQRIFKVVEIPK